MFSCFHVTKLHESIRFHVFPSFNAHFPPQNDVMVNGPVQYTPTALPNRLLTV